eukprot:7393664-Heterocapsa_arctica.AAC.1
MQIMHLSDGPTKDRRKWAEEFNDHCVNKYCDINSEVHKQEEECRRLHEWARTEGAGQTTVWGLGTTLAARSRMVKAKSSGGDDS